MTKLCILVAILIATSGCHTSESTSTGSRPEKETAKKVSKFQSAMMDFMDEIKVLARLCAIPPSETSFLHQHHRCELAFANVPHPSNDIERIQYDYAEAMLTETKSIRGWIQIRERTNDDHKDVIDVYNFKMLLFSQAINKDLLFLANSLLHGDEPAKSELAEIVK